MASIESRVFRRVEFCTSVSCLLLDQRESFECVSENVSDGGMMLSTSYAVEVSSRVQLFFRCEPSAPPVAMAAVVRWIKRGDDERTVFGAEFCDDEPGLEAVRALVERLAPTAWSEGGAGAVPKHIAVQFVPIVRRMARSLSRVVPVHVDDLIAAGFLGLVEAHRTFRPDLNPSFEAYARMRIRGAMMDEARSVDTLSRRQRAVGKVIARARAELVARSGAEPSPFEVARAAGMSLDAVEAHRLAAVAQQPAIEDEIAGVQDWQSTPEASTMRREGLEHVKVALSGLPDRLRQILEMYYGQDMTLRSIASVVGVSEARVSQLHSDAIRRLRERVGAG
jgi:RNA polymerase sigma factor FliA